MNHNNLLEQMDILILDIKILKQSLKECYNNDIERKHLLSQLQEKQKDFKILKEFLFERFY